MVTQWNVNSDKEKKSLSTLTPDAQLVVIQSRAKVVLPKLLDMHQV
jgi:hypothetical protein